MNESRPAHELRERKLRLARCLVSLLGAGAGAPRDTTSPATRMGGAFCEMDIDESHVASISPETLAASDLVLSLLLAEAGADVRSTSITAVWDDLFEQWNRQRLPPYSGVHASARRRLEALGRSSPALAALTAEAAVFEAMTGSMSRARSFAERARALGSAEGSYGVLKTAASVRVFADVHAGRRDRLRGYLQDDLSNHRLEDLELWVDFFVGGQRSPRGVDPEALRFVRRGSELDLARWTMARHYRLRLLLPVLLYRIEPGPTLRGEIRWGQRAIGVVTHPWERLRRASAERALARHVGDDKEEARWDRILQRYRGIVLDRERALPLLLLERL